MNFRQLTQRGDQSVDTRGYVFSAPDVPSFYNVVLPDDRVETRGRGFGVGVRPLRTERGGPDWL